MNKKTKIFLVIIIIASISAIFIYERIEKYNQPYAILDEVIKNALENKEQSAYILNEAEWEDYKTQSNYINVAEAFNWDTFRSMMSKELLDYAAYSISPSESFVQKIKNANRTHVRLEIGFYDSMGKEQGIVNVYFEKNDSNWHIVGWHPNYKKRIIIPELAYEALNQNDRLRVDQATPEELVELYVEGINEDNPNLAIATLSRKTNFTDTTTLETYGERLKKENITNLTIEKVNYDDFVNLEKKEWPAYMLYVTYDLEVPKEIGPSGETTYFVSFVKENGIWKIEHFTTSP